MFDCFQGSCSNPVEVVCLRPSTSSDRISPSIFSPYCKGMFPMAWADLLPHFPHLQIQSIQQESQHVTIRLVSTREGDRCPTCQTQTLAGHGWFTRRIHSLPCSGQAVVLLIQARRFRCPNPACPRKTFREDLSALADRYQRWTQAATQL